jgi:hypothetical protein
LRLGKDIKEGIKTFDRHGAHAVYVQGGLADQACATEGCCDREALDYKREFNVPSGLGAHDLETGQSLRQSGVQAGFWVKTIHPDNYWSATPKENRRVFDVVVPPPTNTVVTMTTCTAATPGNH